MPRQRRTDKRDLDLYLGLLGFVAEHPFKGRNGKRRWRFDYAMPDKMLAVEYHGQGIGHFSHAQAWRDQDKASEAAVCGWRLVICNARSVEDGRCQSWIDALLSS